MGSTVLQFNDDLDLRKADVFSLGCSMYAVITRQELPRNGALWHEIRNGRLRYLPKGQKLVSPIFAAVRFFIIFSAFLCID